MKRLLATLALACIILPGAPSAFSAEQKIVAAHDLLKAFTDNRNAAEEQYLGKIILINGVVLATGISKYMTPNVELSDRKDGVTQVICVLPRLDADKLSGFAPGQNVTMSGKVYKHSSGRMIVKECGIVE